jgi:hypothetical protein
MGLRVEWWADTSLEDGFQPGQHGVGIRIGRAGEGIPVGLAVDQGLKSKEHGVELPAIADDGAVDLRIAIDVNLLQPPVERVVGGPPRLDQSGADLLGPRAVMTEDRTLFPITPELCQHLVWHPKPFAQPVQDRE